MSYYRGYGRRGKPTRAFSSPQGKTPVRKRKGDTVLKVGADAMLEEKIPGKDEFKAGQTIEDLRAERDSYLDMARRERADFDNYRKRIQREMAQMKRDSLAGFLKEFFGPLDDLDRVLAESAKNDAFESLVTGVKLTQDNFWKALTKAGVKKIEARGQPFDPAIHEAMAAVPSVDVPPNTIVDVYENGYELDGFVLRPARVIVSREPDA